MSIPCIAPAAGYANFTGDYYPFLVMQPSGRWTLGVPPILKAKDVLCEECGQVHDIELCPLCGETIFISYGLGGGGCGTIYVCNRSECPWLYKVMDWMEE
jgi:hypothetical protein